MVARDSQGRFILGPRITELSIATGEDRLLAVATPIHGKLGCAFQTFYATSVLNNYGGAVAAAVYSIRPTFAIQAGVEHGFGPRSADFGLILGCNYLYRPKPR